MTFSVTGRCARTGMFGVAITTSSVCVASRCPHARAGVGAVSTQNVTDPSIGTRTLDAMAAGRSAPDALASVLKASKFTEYRQVAVIDRNGRTATHSGSKTLGTNAVAEGKDVVAAGNLLSTTDVPGAMVRSFEANPTLHLGERLLKALEAGVAAGGEMGPVKSCGLLVVHEQGWPLIDLRVDWKDEDPIAELRRIWGIYEPQMNDYITRALNPSSAPSYNVPGDP